jgi:hypothetical protein
MLAENPFPKKVHKIKQVTNEKSERAATLPPVLR